MLINNSAVARCIVTKKMKWGGGGESVVFPIMFSVVYEANSSWGKLNGNS